MDEFNWNAWFGQVKNLLRAFAERTFTVEPDGSGSPETLACRNFFFLFPRPTDVLLLDTSKVTSSRKDGDCGTVVRYDFSNLKPRNVQFHGCIRAEDLQRQPSIINRFGLTDDAVQAVADLSLVLTWDWPRAIHVVPFDARMRVDDYAAQLCMSMVDKSSRFLDEATHEPRCLPATPILPSSKLLSVHPITSMFYGDDVENGLQELQRTVAHIQLLPEVPDQIQRVFNWAKRLYVFGQFEYGFFTIAAHYAYSAIEAALYHRWSQSLSKPVMVVHGDESVTVNTPSQAALIHLCETEGWDRNKVTVNGSKFPWNTGMLLSRLRELGIINDWQKNRFALKLRIRNSYSHMESSPLISPDSGALEQAADAINSLFE